MLHSSSWSEGLLGRDVKWRLFVLLRFPLTAIVAWGHESARNGKNGRTLLLWGFALTLMVAQGLKNANTNYKCCILPPKGDGLAKSVGKNWGPNELFSYTGIHFTHHSRKGPINPKKAQMTIFARTEKRGLFIGQKNDRCWRSFSDSLGPQIEPLL